ncbi:acetylcholinesterase-1 [Ixodes scapularis]|uniref:acetylcholinesterase-1 n=1 Tax=Ixodes scapularis TaxID=6945 RepID=UPI001AD6204B|nr:acetylcholinesterase-1 [Ixodes scapularis]
MLGTMTNACQAPCFPNVLRTVTAVVTVCMVCLARPAKSDVPIVHTDSGLVMGTRATVGDKRVDAFLGIPYAQPPVGDLRFRKPVPISPWKGTYNASSKPKPCWQLKLRFVENQTIDYSSASEDCLYLNVWRPSCTSTMSCEKKKSVIVFIHGGAFQWGDSSLFIYDAANFVALSDVVYVTFNYRLSILGFLSSDTPELPGNMGLWDQNLVLRWVKRNIGNFGGDANDITIDGQSAGGISAGLHAISPHSQGLFKRVIMSSGTSLSIILGISYSGLGKFTGIVGTLGCYDYEKNIKDQLPSVLDCLRKLDAAQIFHTLESVDAVQQIFSPVQGDEFIPRQILSENTYKKLPFKEILLGANLNEGTLFFDNLRYTFPALSNMLSGDYRFAVTVSLGPVFDISLPQARRIVNFYYGDYDVQHDSKTVGDIFSQIFGDAIFNCPTQLFADTASKQGIITYRYVFAHRPSYSFWPGWMGVTHGDEIMSTVGSLPFILDKSRYTEPLSESSRKYLGRLSYTPDEENFMKQLVSAWAAFVKHGKPVIPVPGVDWPLYTSDNPKLLYLQPNNYTVAPDPHREACKLWKPLLYRK